MNYGKKGVKNRQRELTAKGTKIKKSVLITALKAFLIVIISAFIIILCLGIGLFKGIIEDAPDITSLNVIPTGYASVAYDSDGQEIQKLVAANANRRYVTMDNIPQYMADAFVAIEDERFYSHNGIDIQAILRAAKTALSSGRLSQGGSTITQQLLKNNVFDNWTNEKDGEKIVRKIQEQYLAIQLEKNISKEEIIEYYMNTINLGHNTLGVEAASRCYFDKSAYELTLSECTVIAAITQNPSGNDPITHPEKNAIRRQSTLDKMLELEFITKAEYDEAVADNVYSRIQEVHATTAGSSVNSYFVDELIDQVYDALMQNLGYTEQQAYNAIYSGGLSIFTTQDSSIQAICDEVLGNEENYPAKTKWLLDYRLTIKKADGTQENHSSEMFTAYFKEKSSSFDLLYASEEDAQIDIEEYKAAVMAEGDEVFAETIELTPQPQLSLTICDQYTGQVVAMVGGRGVKEGSLTLNRASDTVRQPGSTFKVLSTYAAALDSGGLNLATVFNDALFYDANGRPVSNWWGSEYRGVNSIRTAIKQSMNVITVKCLTQITPALGFNYIKSFGFSTVVESEEINGQIYTDINQSLALGGLTHGVTNMELNAGFATIANQGTYIAPTLFTRILDHDGNVLIDNTAPETHQVLRPTTAFLLTSAMEDVVNSGTGTRAKFSGMSIAGKTGTTTHEVDLWFSGYTPYYTATVWAGYDNNEWMTTSDEQNLAKNMWRKVMEQIHAELPNKSFEVPANIVTATVCSASGKLPIPGLCDATLVTEYFEEGTEPTETCDCHYQGSVCVYSGMIACENCPFKADGIVTLNPVEDASLVSGSVDEAGNILSGTSTTSHYCPHNDEFFADPNSAYVVQQQWNEYIANQNAAAAAGTTP